jgi:pimeloyl-ACP methyl ester carboxylesterase
VLASTEITPTVLSRLYFPASAEAERLGWLERISEVSPDTLVAAAVGEEAEVELRAESDRSLVSGLKSLEAPVLVVASSDDAVSPATEGRVIANELPHATYVSIPGGGYASYSVSETKVLAAISSFVSATLAGLGG